MKATFCRGTAEARVARGGVMVCSAIPSTSVHTLKLCPLNKFKYIRSLPGGAAPECLPTTHCEQALSWNWGERADRASPHGAWRRPDRTFRPQVPWTLLGHQANALLSSSSSCWPPAAQPSPGRALCYSPPGPAAQPHNYSEAASYSHDLSAEETEVSWHLIICQSHREPVRGGPKGLSTAPLASSRACCPAHGEPENRNQTAPGRRELTANRLVERAKEVTWEKCPKANTTEPEIPLSGSNATDQAQEPACEGRRGRCSGEGPGDGTGTPSAEALGDRSWSSARGRRHRE